jgi:glycosyltransferase involved in cell wall biosynthesis
MLRIAHVVSHPIQYFAPLYREITKHPDVELTVLFGSDFGTRPSFDPGLGQTIQFDTPLLEGFTYEFLPNAGDGKPGGDVCSFDCPSLNAILSASRFDCVWIHGWGYRMQRQAALAAQQNNIPYVIRGETTLLDAPKYSLRWLRRFVLYRQILQRAAACLYVGIQNRRFYRSMGIPETRLRPAHYSVDASFFTRQILSAEDRTAFRTSRNTSDSDLVISTVAKLIPRKRVGDLVEAVAACDSAVRLWVLGDGELSESLRLNANQLAPGRVEWFGFTNQQAIPRILSASDVFALASDEETWGLVVNEAMACGLPAIVSDRIGCGEDLVLPGETGFRYSCRNQQSLLEQIQRMQNRDLRSEMGPAAQSRVLKEYSCEATARQIVEAIRDVC